jgi:RNA polymerase sigma factor (sigma-70 family)
MDLATLVGRAQRQDLDAFAAITRRFQHMAFGYALAILSDFGEAEDVVQEAFVAAWFGLARLEEPAAFPGWLRGIVRHRAHRVLRRKHLEALPLSQADRLPADMPEPDRRIEDRRRAGVVLAAITELPEPLREVVTLFYVHECSQQDIATFLDQPLTTVNNRLHEARARLKRRMTMVKGTFESHALPDDFAARIGRIVRTRPPLIEARFDPAALPEVLTELAVSDEGGRRAVPAFVVQRLPDGVVRGVMTASDAAPTPGMTVMNAGRPSQRPLSREAFERTVRTVAERPHDDDRPRTLLETGIKVIDVMCPLVSGGTVAVAGEYRAGTVVIVEELVRRLAGGLGRLSIFSMVPMLTMPISEAWEKEGYSEGTVGAVQTFYLPGENEPWTAERLDDLAGVDAVVRLSYELARLRIYPPADALTSRSRLLETDMLGPEHLDVAARGRRAVALYTNSPDAPPPGGDAVMWARGGKLLRFFAQPFFVAEPYTKRPGLYVPLIEALRGCRAILDGECDDLPTEAFYFTGTLDDVRRSAAALAAPREAGGEASSGETARP